MTPGAKRYNNVNELWIAVAPPAITAHEAERAARALYRKFGRKGEYPLQRATAKFRELRRVWVTKSNTLDGSRGWPRLVHDIAHRIHDARYRGSRRPHDPLHAKFEYEIAEYVVNETDWLRGTLASAPMDPAKLSEKKLASVQASLKRWASKLRRAQNAIKKLERRRARLSRGDLQPRDLPEESK